MSIFDHAGKYVKSLGMRGDKDGEFRDAYCIAISDKDYVYVSDTRRQSNSSVQVVKTD